ADGSAALAQLARASRTPIVVVDAGVREPDHMPAVTVRLDVVQPVAQLEAGIAVAISLAEGDPLALLVLGALGVGSELASAAITGAITRVAPTGLADREAEAIGARAAALAMPGALELLVDRPDIGVLAGLILGAASMNVAVVLDGHVTGTAALIAAQLAPAVRGYLIAAHRGSFTMPSVLAQLELEPVFEVGLGHGEGSGGAMIVPLVDQVASLTGSDAP
ncbi:MAG TPA: nicotinate-nucleotide--dimethylbenzimidazole phosphoribosyltransferase, partial [Kofleriaceae bacterium]